MVMGLFSPLAWEPHEGNAMSQPLLCPQQNQHRAGHIIEAQDCWLSDEEDRMDVQRKGNGKERKKVVGL